MLILFYSHKRERERERNDKKDMKNENEQSLEVYKNILFVESNKYTILPNKLASI